MLTGNVIFNKLRGQPFSNKYAFGSKMFDEMIIICVNLVNLCGFNNNCMVAL